VVAVCGAAFMATSSEEEDGSVGPWSCPDCTWRRARMQVLLVQEVLRPRDGFDELHLLG
jgi:hypothetical protein